MSEEATKAPAPALGFSITANLGKDRQLVLQTHVGNDCDLGALNAMLDKLAAAADRQKAIADLETEEAELETNLRAFEQAQEDEQRCRIDWDARHALKMRELEQIGENREKALKEARGDHQASGRRTEFAPSKTLLRPYDQDAQKLAAEIAKAQVEHEAELGNWAATAKKWQTVVARARERIAKLKAKAGRE